MQCKLPRNSVALSGSLGHPKLFISTNLRSQPDALSFPTLQSTVSYKLWFSRCNLWTPVIPESLSRSMWNQNYSHNNMKGFFFFVLFVVWMVQQSMVRNTSETLAQITAAPPNWLYSPLPHTFGREGEGEGDAAFLKNALDKAVKIN